MDTHDVVGGEVTGYSEARVARTVAICAQGAAHGAWKDTIRRAVGGRDERCDSQSARVVISLMVDIVAAVG
jgi:hypothetical protein